MFKMRRFPNVSDGLTKEFSLDEAETLGQLWGVADESWEILGVLHLEGGEKESRGGEGMEFLEQVDAAELLTKEEDVSEQKLWYVKWSKLTVPHLKQFHAWTSYFGHFGPLFRSFLLLLFRFLIQ